jgi:hypothetical protein
MSFVPLSRVFLFSPVRISYSTQLLNSSQPSTMSDTRLSRFGRPTTMDPQSIQLMREVYCRVSTSARPHSKPLANPNFPGTRLHSPSLEEHHVQHVASNLRPLPSAHQESSQLARTRSHLLYQGSGAGEVG